MRVLLLATLLLTTALPAYAGAGIEMRRENDVKIYYGVPVAPAARTAVTPRPIVAGLDRHYRGPVLGKRKLVIGGVPVLR